MRAFALVGVLALAACSRGAAPSVAEGGEHADCALGAGAVFAPVCAVERSTQDGQKVLVIRHPDGAFRRLMVLQDGTGIASADGAETTRVGTSGNLLEVSIGPDRYRIPFTVKDAPAGATPSAEQ